MTTDPSGSATGPAAGQYSIEEEDQLTSEESPTLRPLSRGRSGQSASRAGARSADRVRAGSSRPIKVSARTTRPTWSPRTSVSTVVGPPRRRRRSM